MFVSTADVEKDSVLLLRGSRYLVIKEVGLKDYIHCGFLDPSPQTLGICTVCSRKKLDCGVFKTHDCRCCNPSAASRSAGVVGFGHMANLQKISATGYRNSLTQTEVEQISPSSIAGTSQQRGGPAESVMVFVERCCSANFVKLSFFGSISRRCLQLVIVFLGNLLLAPLFLHS